MVPETSLWSYWTRFLGFCPGLNFMVHAIVIYNLALGLNSIQVLIELLKNEVCQQHCVFRSWKPLSPWLFGEEIHFAIYVLILQRSSLELRFSSWAWISQKVREVRFCLSSMNGVFFEWVSIKRTGSWNFYSGLKPVPSISFFFCYNYDLEPKLLALESWIHNLIVVWPSANYWMYPSLSFYVYKVPLRLLRGLNEIRIQSFVTYRGW